MRPIKRIVVAGGRDYSDYAEAKEFIEECIRDIRADNELVFVSGVCRGADMLGERFAKENGCKIERFPANWELYGNAAGPIRNKEMARVADLVICFWDRRSRGTASMIHQASSLGKEVKIKYI